MLAGYERVLTVGCGTCVAVCLAGGEKEVHLLATQLRMAAGVEGRPLLIDELTLERQCDREFLEPLARRVEGYDALLSTACGAGVQYLAERYPERPVLPALNTSFIGVAEGPGVWSERCRACNDCLLSLTGGICPLTMCAKGLLNGPCGGATLGRCEVDPERPCAWGQIYERLAAQGRLALLQEIRPPLRHELRGHPGRLIHRAYQRRYGTAAGH
jgi:hypothetical protein